MEIPLFSPEFHYLVCDSIPHTFAFFVLWLFPLYIFFSCHRMLSFLFIQIVTHMFSKLKNSCKRYHSSSQICKDWFVHPFLLQSAILHQDQRGFLHSLVKIGFALFQRAGNLLAHFFVTKRCLVALTFIFVAPFVESSCSVNGPRFRM